MSDPVLRTAGRCARLIGDICMRILHTTSLFVPRHFGDGFSAKYNISITTYRKFAIGGMLYTRRAIAYNREDDSSLRTKQNDTN